MNRLFQPKIFLAIALSLACVGVKAQYYFSASMSYTNYIPQTATEWTGTVALPQFNPWWGTLESVDIYVSSKMMTVITVTNYDSTGSRGRVKTEVMVSLDNDTLANLFGGDPVLDYLSSNYVYRLSPGESVTSGNISSRLNYNDTGPLTDPDVLALFTGDSYVDLSANATATPYLLNAGGNASSSQSSTANLSTIVTYEFEPQLIPEPSTFAMLVTGLASLGFAFRRHLVR